MTFSYTQTGEVRERDHVGRIRDRLKSNKDAALAAMPAFMVGLCRLELQTSTVSR